MLNASCEIQSREQVTERIRTPNLLLLHSTPRTKYEPIYSGSSRFASRTDIRQSCALRKDPSGSNKTTILPQGSEPYSGVSPTNIIELFQQTRKTPTDKCTHRRKTLTPVDERCYQHTRYGRHGDIKNAANTKKTPAGVNVSPSPPPFPPCLPSTHPPVHRTRLFSPTSLRPYAFEAGCWLFEGAENQLTAKPTTPKHSHRS